MSTVTISRQHGSGGREVAERVRELLDYRFFDKALMMRLAADAGIAAGSIADFSEAEYKARTFLDRLNIFNPSEMVVSPKAIRDLNVSGGWPDDAGATGLAQKLIEAAYERGNVVIVGRGAQVILQGKPDVLHVRVVAPTEMRLQRLQEVEGLSPADARQRVEDRDRATQDFMQRYFGVEWDNPCLYHLTINTGLYTLEQAAHVILLAKQQLAGG